MSGANLVWKYGSRAQRMARHVPMTSSRRVDFIPEGAPRRSRSEKPTHVNITRSLAKARLERMD